MNDLYFAIGILSWKGYDSLENSLASYQKNGLSNLTNNKFVCLPEYTEQGIKIVEKYHYKPILIKENLGILEGFKKLAEKTTRFSCSTISIVLFLAILLINFVAL